MANNSSTDKMDLAPGQGHGGGAPEQETHETDKPTEGSGDETVGIIDTSMQEAPETEAVDSTRADIQPAAGDTAGGELSKVLETESGGEVERPTNVVQSTTEGEPKAENLPEDKRPTLKVEGDKTDKEEVVPAI